MASAKTEKTILLNGFRIDGKSARLGNEVRVLKNSKGSVIVERREDGTAIVTTHKGSYTLVKHETLNQYHGELAGVKARLTCKKLVAQLTYWAA